MKHPIAQVGAPDPERETSPIFDEDADELSLDLGLEAAACHFNGEPFELGEYVLSGNELLQCGERGVWLRRGEMAPEKDIVG